MSLFSNSSPLHCKATKRNVAVAITDGVNRIFHSHNLSGSNMALGLTQASRETNIRNFSWGKGGRCVGQPALTHSCADCLEIWQHQPHETLWASNRPLPLLPLQALPVNFNVQDRELFKSCK